LASWDRIGHPDHVRLTAYLDEIEHALTVTLKATADHGDPLALRLDVGLPGNVPLLVGHDLDNYLFPVAQRLAPRIGTRLTTVWGTKGHGSESWIRLEDARSISTPRSDIIATAGHSAGQLAAVRTTASTDRVAFKQQIHNQLHRARHLPEGPVHLQVSLRSGPHRNWLNLWKPTIDALAPVLGSSRPGRSWHPRDGRITDLGLHRHTDPELGHDVEITIWVSPAQVT